MKPFLFAGDILINPALLAYAAVEVDSDGNHVRLGLLGESGDAPCEVRLSGTEARSVLRWLKANSEFLDAGGPSYRAGRRPSLQASTGRALSSCY